MILVERRPPLPRSASIYQPVFRSFVDSKEEQYLESKWLEARTANRGLGYGKLFLQRQNSVQMYPDEASDLWVPTETWSGREVLRSPNLCASSNPGRLPEWASTRGFEATTQGNACLQSLSEHGGSRSFEEFVQIFAGSGRSDWK